MGGHREDGAALAGTALLPQAVVTHWEPTQRLPLRIPPPGLRANLGNDASKEISKGKGWSSSQAAQEGSLMVSTQLGPLPHSSPGDRISPQERLALALEEAHPNASPAYVSPSASPVSHVEQEAESQEKVPPHILGEKPAGFGSTSWGSSTFPTAPDT